MKLCLAHQGTAEIPALDDANGGSMMWVSVLKVK